MVTRTFLPDAYQTALSAGLNWDQAGYSAALTCGLLAESDPLGIGWGT